MLDQEPCVVAIEACATTRHRGHVAMARGHEERAIPAIYSRPFAKRQKNNFADAAAIADPLAAASDRQRAIRASRPRSCSQAGISTEIGSPGTREMKPNCTSPFEFSGKCVLFKVAARHSFQNSTDPRNCVPRSWRGTATGFDGSKIRIDINFASPGQRHGGSIGVVGTLSFTHSVNLHILFV